MHCSYRATLFLIRVFKRNARMTRSNILAPFCAELSNWGQLLLFKARQHSNVRKGYLAPLGGYAAAGATTCQIEQIAKAGEEQGTTRANLALGF